MPDVDTAGGDGEGARHGAPVLIEEDAAAAVFLHIGFAQQVNPAERCLAIAFQLADDRAGVQMITAGQAQDLGQHAEVNAVVGVAVEHGVHGAMDVQQHPVLPAPVGQAGVGAEAAGDVVVHDDGCAELLGELGPLVHLFRRRRRDVQIVPLALAGFLLRLVDRLHHELEAVAPAHERLRVDVFVVLGEIQAAAQALVHRAPVVLGRQPELRFDGAAQQRTAVLVQLVALHLDTVRRTAAGLHVGKGEVHILQAQVTQGLEAENVAHQGSEYIDHRALFEEIDGVCDEGVERFIVARHVLDAIGTALVVVQVGQEIRPHRGPGAGR